MVLVRILKHATKACPHLSRYNRKRFSFVPKMDNVFPSRIPTKWTQSIDWTKFNCLIPLSYSPRYSGCANITFSTLWLVVANHWYITWRILHGRAEIRNFREIFHEWAQRTSEIFFNTRREISSVSPSGHVMFYLLYKRQRNTRWALLCSDRPDLLCDHSNCDLFTCEDNMLFSRVKRRYVFARKLTWYMYFIGVYIIKKVIQGCVDHTNQSVSQIKKGGASNSL